MGKFTVVKIKGTNITIDAVFPGEDPILLTPAYGRSYDNEAEILADFNGGKDFKIFEGPYMSIRDWEGEDIVVITKGKTYAITESINYESLKSKRMEK